jgi:malonate-semialdehyde dehydrogenase (acetylating)/methylmalonate-semialdehyde dehydrogenase
MLITLCRHAQPTVKLLINGEFVESKTSNWLDVHNPVGWSLICPKDILYLLHYLHDSNQPQLCLQLHSTIQATQEVVSRLPLTTPAEFNAAVAAAKEAFPAWRATPVPTRARVMLKLQQLIRENWVGGDRGGAAHQLRAKQPAAVHQSI